mmetsp:Transcript_46447/g.86619  ORF Transcript_46447/g.86619 Transcript_46447/m.86619 type:complete len:91 (-) Transcript_46447:63-335(-)
MIFLSQIPSSFYFPSVPYFRLCIRNLLLTVQVPSCLYLFVKVFFDLLRGRLVKIFRRAPKMPAKRVLFSVMTLKGMEKSGIGGNSSGPAE